MPSSSNCPALPRQPGPRHVPEDAQQQKLPGAALPAMRRLSEDPAAVVGQDRQGVDGAEPIQMIGKGRLGQVSFEQFPVGKPPAQRRGANDGKGFARRRGQQGETADRIVGIDLDEARISRIGQVGPAQFLHEDPVFDLPIGPKGGGVGGVVEKMGIYGEGHRNRFQIIFGRNLDFGTINCIADG